MKIINFNILVLLLLLVSCNSTHTNNKEINTDTTNTISISESEEIKKTEEWNFMITPLKVGLISTSNSISEISDLLPPNYSIEKDSEIFDNDDKDNTESLIYAIRKNNKTIFEIIPKEEDNDKIQSIVILSPEYTIINTELSVGSTFGALKKTFSIKDTYFNISDGLYIYCNEFNGAFSIDLEGKGDEYESLESLPDGRKIKTIVIY